MRIDFHPAATTELEASANWYAERSVTAARDFCVAVEIALSSISADPERFGRVDSRHRACSVQRFPFQIVFRNERDRLLVVAVAHAKRAFLCRPSPNTDRNLKRNVGMFNYR